MSQPIDDHIKRIDARQDEFEARLKEVESGQTEPMKTINMYELLLQTNTKLDAIIQAQQGGTKKLEIIENSVQKVDRDLETHSTTWLNTLQENFDELTQKIDGIHAETLKLRESQADFKDTLKDHTARMERIESTMVVKEDIKDMATKADIATLKAIQERQELLLQEILNRLPPR